MKEIRRRNRTSTLAIKQPPLPTSWVYLISFILRIGSRVEPWQYSRALHASRYRCDHQSVANIATKTEINKQNKRKVKKMNISKYFTGQSVELKRSAIHFADYNPREINDEERKNIKRGIKKFGLLGGIVVNKQTGLTLVQGHQRISIMDELEKYNPETKENDYVVRAEVIDVDLKTEKVINILLNNPNAQGKWNRDKLAQLVTEVDYKDAGISDADLSLLGLDYMFQTEAEQDIANSLGELMQGVEDEKQAEREEKTAQRLAEKQAEQAAKIAHMKEVKQEVREAAQKSADNMDAYVMLSFTNIEARNTFLQRFGYPTDSKFIKGEDFDMRVEAADYGEE